MLFQGFFDRFLYMASADDPSLMLTEQILPIAQDKQIDMEQFLRTVIRTHTNDPVYTISAEGFAEAQKIHEEMRVQYLASDCGRELLALRSKSFANHLKLAAIVCCTRNTLKIMKGELDSSSFEVTQEDVKTAAAICRWSNHILTSFKVNNVLQHYLASPVK